MKCHFLKSFSYLFLKWNVPIFGYFIFVGLKALGESVINKFFINVFTIIFIINLLKCMENNGCRTIVFSSSATIYGH